MIKVLLHLQNEQLSKNTNEEMKCIPIDKPCQYHQRTEKDNMKLIHIHQRKYDITGTG